MSHCRLTRRANVSPFRRANAMRIAFFSDLHANREAFEACLAHADAQRIDRMVFLGDYVGYGADPDWMIDRVADLIDRGAAAIVGNHDQELITPGLRMNANALIAIGWTRNRVTAAQRDLIARLPMSLTDDNRLYVHGDASAPADFRYVTDADDAARSLKATNAFATFVGHVHIPALFALSATGKRVSFRPQTDQPIPLSRQYRWTVVVGSVGQPRDRDPGAAYTVLDTDRGDITFHRVPYDIQAAADKIMAAGLPDALAQRLFRGL